MAKSTIFAFMDSQEYVILVDNEDREIGQMEKQEAHQKGLLHRAISVFIFNTKGEFLLQKRASHKYHSADLWTNTCCSHPRPDELTLDAANRRLNEEMGLHTELQWLTSFIYQVELENNLIEHELDHVFVGITDNSPGINSNEAADHQYIRLDALVLDVQLHPEKYTFWFKALLDEVTTKFHQNSF